MSTFTVYGTTQGSTELPEFLGAFATRTEAESLVDRWRVSGIDFFDFYLISMEVGGVRFTEFVA